MNATAVRTSTAGALGTTATARTTNGPSSTAPTAGGGPVAAPANQAYLGEQTLPAPVGQPQTLHLPDGSMLVPIARVDASGNRTPLAGGAGSAPLTGGGADAAAAAQTPAAGGALHAAEGAQVTAGGQAIADDDFEPMGFLYNGDYYKRYFEDGGIDVNDRTAVEERSIESTFKYLKDREPEVDDFGITGVGVRRVDPSRDGDLLHVNPRALYVVDVHGVQGNGHQRSIPTVMNQDGTTFTDPRLRIG
ncbi:MAG: hypothetical protein KDC46_05565 [Thermoleophilia bacterium]|nr:hypothetical protein [Thermoleophilia bacterium]